MEKLLRDRGVRGKGGRGGGSLRKREVPNIFISFPSGKHVFITVEILFLFGKYSRFL